jgi:hypothetical protein
MSVSGEPTADDLAAQFPLSAAEAQAIADAMTPFQNIIDVGASGGKVLEDLPGPGLPLAGTMLQHLAAQANLVSVSLETLARALTFYVEAQSKGLAELFPPPHELAAQVERDIQPVSDALRGGAQEPF